MDGVLVKFYLGFPWQKLHLITKKTPWPQSASELYGQSGRRRSAKLVPTFAGRGVSRGQRNGSPTAVNLCFPDL
jgi:hypothetical protein